LAALITAGEATMNRTIATLASFPALILAFLNAATAQTVTGCLNREGELSHVAIGDKPAKPCGRKATQVTLGAKGPQGEQGPAGPRGLKGDKGEPGSPGSWVVRDRDNKLVGAVLLYLETEIPHPAAGGALVLYKGDPLASDFFQDFPVVSVKVGRGGFVGGANVFFEKPNCDDSGAVYTDLNESEAFGQYPRVAVIDNAQSGAVMYVPQLPRTITPTPTFAASSTREGEPTCTTETIDVSNRVVFTRKVPLGLFPPYSLGE
jgi:hypothetical protein